MSQNDTQEKLTDETIALLKEMAKDISFGCISIVFQDGKVIQIEKNEKIRLK